MIDITIPPEVLAAVDEVIFYEGGSVETACIAMLKSWPGMVLHPGTHISPACVWLPVADGGTVWVTQEKPDDKG